MAFLEELKITGSLGNLSFYKMRGVDKIVVRRKGGAPREYVKNSPTFKVPRLNMSEFGGCSKMGKEVRFMMHPVRVLSDYNFSGFINKALKIVQKQDGIGELGQRSIMLSRHPGLLAGFQLNKNTMFDSVLRTPITYVLDRKTLSARVNIPALLRDINFHPNNRHARFCIDVSLGIVPDFNFDPKEGAYKPSAWYTTMFAPKSVSSPWFPALKGSPATSLEIALTDQVPADDSYSLMLTVGVRYGSPMEDDVVKDVKRAGVAKVIAVAGRPEGEGSENKQPGTVSKVEGVGYDGEKQPITSVQSVAACTFGWRSATANQLVESAAYADDRVKAEVLPLPENNPADYTYTPDQPETSPAPGISTCQDPKAGLRLLPGAVSDTATQTPCETTAIPPFQEAHDARSDDEDG
ncbi:hypothetical protein [Parachryseolinea silvisoli]|uniref:hypothetical protein n=1 Tax=Parachryseolinea silvisoli TaxID=2873601 RepID=UPI002265EF73|nr:hypothetical protein [Parachryseolinea silvisoli]MCD9018062.1 hypothetical protein [Parachryseolinea silvisoli]